MVFTATSQGQKESSKVCSISKSASLTLLTILFIFSVAQEVLTARNVQPNFFRLVSAFREHAHKQASINPVALKPLRYITRIHTYVDVKNFLTNIVNF